MGAGRVTSFCWALICIGCFAHWQGAEAGGHEPLQTKFAKQQREKIGPWADVVAWTHSWDMLDVTTYKDDGSTWSIPPATRVDSVADRGANKRDLKRDNGRWGFNLGVRQIPGPKVVPSARQFNGRPAWLSDFLGRGRFLRRGLHDVVTGRRLSRQQDVVQPSQGIRHALLGCRALSPGRPQTQFQRLGRRQRPSWNDCDARQISNSTLLGRNHQCRAWRSLAEDECEGFRQADSSCDRQSRWSPVVHWNSTGGTPTER